MNESKSWEESVLWLRGQPHFRDLVRDSYFDDPLYPCWERFRASTEWKATQGVLQTIPRGKALDVGAGRGIASFALFHDGWEVTALEPDPSDVVGAGAIRVAARDAGISIQVVESKAETIPFPSGHFQLVYARQALHHAENLEAFCREVRRVLAPGGTFIALREHVIDGPKDLPIFLAAHPLHSLYGGENAYTLRRYRRALVTADLQIAKVIGPFDSDINLFPATQDEIRKRIALRTRLPLPRWMYTKAVAPLLNRFRRTPGRLYTFVSRAPSD